MLTLTNARWRVVFIITSSEYELILIQINSGVYSNM